MKYTDKELDDIHSQEELYNKLCRMTFNNAMSVAKRLLETKAFCTQQDLHFTVHKLTGWTVDELTNEFNRIKMPTVL